MCEDDRVNGSVDLEVIGCDLPIFYVLDAVVGPMRENAFAVPHLGDFAPGALLSS
jgi:hypothetical protein